LRARQARLYVAFAHLSPGIPAGIWLHAATATDMVWAGRLERGVTPAHLKERALDAMHFEFRFGETIAGTDRMSRATDRL
jgi:hypothetical protein